MEQLTIELSKNGWKQHTQNPFPEKVSSNAKSYFTFDCANNNQVGICIFDEQKYLNLRISHQPTQEVRWFQVKYEDKLTQFIQLLIEEQEQINFSSYFNFYLKMTTLCHTSILAWEQWEKR